MLDPPPGDTPSIGARMARGSIWMVAMWWAIRGIGLISTIVLARLLLPRDFGIVATAMIIVGFMEIFGEAGVSLALIRNPNATRKHYDTAWTLKIFQGFALAAIIALVAPAAARFFSQPELTMVIRVLALRAIIEGFENIGVVAFRKELNFAKEFHFQIYRRLLVFALSITAALVLRNHWALVTGMVAGPFLGVVLSYRMHPYRPRPSVAKLSEIWSFSKWILTNNLGEFLFRQVDQVVVARTAGTAAMGQYTVAMDLATMPVRTAVRPIEQALFPGYAKLAGDHQLMARTYLVVLGIVGSFAVSIGLGIAALADDIVVVVLGPNWSAAAPVMEWLGVFGAVSGFTYSINTIFTVIGRVKIVAYRTWWQLGVLAPSAALAGIMGGIADIAMARAAVAAIFVIVSFHLLVSTKLVTFAEILSAIWRPIAAGVVMFAILRATVSVMPGDLPIRLAIEVLVGAAIFLGTSLLLWLLSGRPDGTERVTLQFVKRSFRPRGKQ